MAGTILLFAVLLLSLAGAALSPFKKGEGPSRLLALFAFGAALLASVFLFYLILTDNFGYAYVAGYSSMALPLFYKVSAFWAGQEGSFLLWLTIHTAAGAYLLWRGRLVGAGASFYLALGAGLTVLVLLKSPFEPLATIPFDGMGLNPLLQDPWMAVHPPIVFVGYALLAVPVAYSFGALLSGEGGAWLAAARRWALFAWAFLGAGIFIGGYWAYKVLGWGGYWGWDPVENSSLVPWLIACALIHVLRVARVRPGAMFLAHLAAIFSYALVIYGTFLTRSGILGDFSVHSFSGGSVGLAIALFNALVVIVPLVVLILKLKELPEGRLYEDYGAREFLLLLGSLVLVFIAALVFLGMSMPLFTELAGAPAAVDTSFYVRTTMPLTIVLAALLAISPFRLWGGRRLSVGVLPLLGLPLGAGLVLTLGLREILPIVLAAVSTLALAATLRAWKRHGLTGCAALTHGGVALGLLAMVLAGSCSMEESAELKPGESAEIFGYEVTYEGQEFAEDGAAKFYRYTVDGASTAAMTKLRESGEDAAREPAIKSFFRGDVYLSPSPTSAEREEILLKHGVPQMDERFAYRLDGVRTEPDGLATKVIAELTLTDGERLEKAEPFIIAQGESGKSSPIEVMAGEKRVRLTGVSGDQREIRLELLPSAAEEAALPVRVSLGFKPYISFLWAAAAFVVLGGLLALRCGKVD